MSGPGYTCSRDKPSATLDIRNVDIVFGTACHGCNFDVASLCSASAANLDLQVLLNSKTRDARPPKEADADVTRIKLDFRLCAPFHHVMLLPEAPTTQTLSIIMFSTQRYCMIRKARTTAGLRYSIYHIAADNAVCLDYGIGERGRDVPIAALCTKRINTHLKQNAEDGVRAAGLRVHFCASNLAL